MKKYIAYVGLGVLTACSQPNFDDAEWRSPTAANTRPTAGDGASDPSSSQYFSQRVGDRVLFQVDQYTLTAVGKTTLDAQAAWLQQNMQYNVTIEGHADEQGTREYNLALGARRARSVQEYLVSRGISAARLRTLSFGKERPLEICSQEECYAKNRRAVTVLAGGLS